MSRKSSNNNIIKIIKKSKISIKKPAIQNSLNINNLPQNINFNDQIQTDNRKIEALECADITPISNGDTFDYNWDDDHHINCA